MAELRQFRLPDVGEGLTEADIVKWHVQPGDQVKINQIIVDIETAKAVVELPSPYEGVVAELLVAEGVTADVGTPIISVDVSPGAGGAAADQSAEGAADHNAEGAADQGEAATADALAEDLVPPPPPAEAGAEPRMHGTLAPKPERQAVLVGYGVKLGSTKRRARKAPGPDGMAAAASAASTTTTTTEIYGAAGASRPDRGERPAVLAKPPVRKLARDRGVDMSALEGTGPGGSITRDDVLSAAGGDAGRPVQLAAVASVPREERIPIRGVRKHTAAAVTASAFTAPHVTTFLQVDMTETMAATARLRSLPDFGGVRVSPLLFVARALLVAAARQPMINSSWDEAARAGKATPADLAGGTITITNVGVFGVDAGTPILTPGEAAILAFGQVKEAPWVYAGQLAVRKVATLALSFDHRIVDGDMGSAVLRDTGAMLTDPLNMLAWS